MHADFPTNQPLVLTSWVWVREAHEQPAATISWGGERIWLCREGVRQQEGEEERPAGCAHCFQVDAVRFNPFLRMSSARRAWRWEGPYWSKRMTSRRRRGGARRWERSPFLSS
eukprot:2420947-Rhodomonas_salina.2